MLRNRLGESVLEVLGSLPMVLSAALGDLCLLQAMPGVYRLDVAACEINVFLRKLPQTQPDALEL